MSVTRWEQFYLQDEGVYAAPPSNCAKWAAERFAKHGVKRVLDLGCGYGRDASYLSSQGFEVFGFDAARSGLNIARNRTQTSSLPIRFVQGDARQLPFLNGSFDAVYCFGLLHEFVGESASKDVALVMDEIYRMLKLGGFLALAILAGEPEVGLPDVQLFTEDMFAAATSRFETLDKDHCADVGCTGKEDYKVWRGLLAKREG